MGIKTAAALLLLFVQPALASEWSDQIARARAASPSDSVALFEQAANMLKPPDLRLELTLKELACAYANAGRHTEARDCLLRLLQQQEASFASEIEISDTQKWLYMDEKVLGNMKQAKTHAMRMLEIAKNMRGYGGSEQYLTALEALSDVMLLSGEQDPLRDLMEKQTRFNEVKPTKKQLAKFLLLKARTSMLAGMNNEAYAFATEALKVADDPQSKVELNDCLAESNMFRGKFAESKSLTNKTVSLLEQNQLSSNWCNLPRCALRMAEIASLENQQANIEPNVLKAIGYVDDPALRKNIAVEFVQRGRQIRVLAGKIRADAYIKIAFTQKQYPQFTSDVRALLDGQESI